MRVSHDIEQNIQAFKQIYDGNSDIKMQEMTLGRTCPIRCFLAFIEVSLSSTTKRESAVGSVVTFLQEEGYVPNTDSPENYQKKRVQALDENYMGIPDLTYFDTIEEAAQGLLTGDAILFVEGYTRALKVADAGYPKKALSDSDSEKVVRGSNEAFADSIKVNTALIRKRVRSTRMQVEQLQMGVYSHTAINLVYINGLVQEELLCKIKKRLATYLIDSVPDSGVLEQLSEKKWYSPFPQFQTTQRPDRAALAILEGRVILLCDNSPIALILPTDFNSFLKTSDDYYNRFEVATFARILRYAASFLAMTLPGLYLAMTNFHTQILPTTLLLSFQEARMGVPFPAVLEVILMELSFELLREAGVRLPGAMGNTIGIVGGLIIGQAAVDANLVSPIVVILVAFTALCSFAIPNDEFAFSFRILKFFFIAMCAWLGFYGFLLAIAFVLAHLTRLESFGIPYLSPFVGAELTDYQDEKDSIVRFPLCKLTKRPIYAQRDQRTKLKRRE